MIKEISSLPVRNLLKNSSITWVVIFQLGEKCPGQDMKKGSSLLGEAVKFLPTDAEWAMAHCHDERATNDLYWIFYGKSDEYFICLLLSTQQQFGYWDDYFRGGTDQFIEILRPFFTCKIIQGTHASSSVISSPSLSLLNYLRNWVRDKNSCPGTSFNTA